MAATAPKSFEYDIDVEDVEYLRHGDTPLLARLFKPRGQGPFPALVELHGGAWCLGDRLQDTTINEQLARSGQPRLIPARWPTSITASAGSRRRLPR